MLSCTVIITSPLYILDIPAIQQLSLYALIRSDERSDKQAGYDAGIELVNVRLIAFLTCFLS